MDCIFIKYEYNDCEHIKIEASNTSISSIYKQVKNVNKYEYTHKLYTAKRFT